jgi:hypothetical protein
MFAPLGADVVIRVVNPRASQSGDIVVWANHGIGENIVGLDDSVESATRALGEFQRVHQLETGHTARIAGLVVQPTATIYDHPGQVDRHSVRGLAVPLSGRGFLDAIEEAGSALRDLGLSVA